MSAISNLGHRQHQLLKALLLSPNGLSMDQLAQELAISRTAVNQHLVNLEKLQYVDSLLQASTGGRPGRVYVLTKQGQELFPRHYSLFARLLLRLVQQKLGEPTLKECLAELGEQLSLEYRDRVVRQKSPAGQVAEVKRIMYELGYETDLEHTTVNEIVASNCVFHELAMDCKEVCELDISLISRLLDARVEHKECMVRGGSCCRFAITPLVPDKSS
ncbi:MAG TPA: HTH domain-containing protein [Methylophilaceae bacterium]|nr:HTH domain-containing protein [Methylophilaceae bacterium]